MHIFKATRKSLFSGTARNSTKHAISIFNQAAFVAAQALVLICIYKKLGMPALDEAFLALAIATPFYVFLLAGGRQLYASNIIDLFPFIKTRLITTSLFAVLTGGTWWLIGRDLFSASMLALIVSWKINDLTQDMAGIVLQKAGYIKALFFSSLARIFIVVPAFFVQSDQIIPLLISTFLSLTLLTFLLLMKHAEYQGGSIATDIIRRGLGLGVAAAASAITVAVPRLVLGKTAEIGSGVVAFIGVASYVYLIGQIVISALAPSLIASTLKLEPEYRHGMIKRMTYIGSGLYLGILVAIAIGYHIIANHFTHLQGNEKLFSFVLIFIYIGTLGNTIEALLSTVGGETLAAKAAMVALASSSILALLFIGPFGAYGYCISLSIAFMLRFAVLRAGIEIRESHANKGGRFE